MDKLWKCKEFSFSFHFSFLPVRLDFLGSATDNKMRLLCKDDEIKKSGDLLGIFLDGGQPATAIFIDSSSFS